MPTYEYACKSCGEHLEVVQSFKDEPLTTCPQCAGELRKVFGSIGIAFKGSGFYKTDSRPAAAKGDSAAKTESSPSKTESAPAKTESAPAKAEPSSATPSSSAAS